LEAMDQIDQSLLGAKEDFLVALPTIMEYVKVRCLSPAFDQGWESHGEIDRAVDLYRSWAEYQAIDGATVWVSEIPGRTPALVIDVPGTYDSTQTVLLYGHLDKQPAVAPWRDGTDPFEAVQRGDRIYGRGVADDGYAMFAALAGIQAARRSGGAVPRCVVFIEASEESGSPDLDAHLEKILPSLGEVGLVVCLDSGGLDFERLWITTSLRGNLVLTVSVKVLEHGVHSGSASGVVPSSFRVLRALLSRVEDESTGDLKLPILTPEVPEFYLDKAQALEEELGDPLGKAFPVVEGLSLMGDSGSDRLVRQTWRGALSVTGIEGVPEIESGGNVLRSYTKAKLSFRLPPNVDAQAAQDEIVRVLTVDPPYGAEVVVETETPAQGWVAPLPAPWLAKALDEASLLAFGKPVGYCGEGGTIPFLYTLGAKFPKAEFVATGVLGPGSNAHGPDESLSIPTAQGVSVAVAKILSAMPESIEN
jgi:acetylornithine deacetylase/succinyl-diaminopimelate desuccinylase-like protein